MHYALCTFPPLAFGLAIFPVMLIGLLPPLKIGSMDLQETTRAPGQGRRTGHRYLPRVFVIIEMALAVLLSAGAAL